MNQAGKPRSLIAVDLGDALVQAEAGDRADVLVPVVVQLPPRSAATMLAASVLACRTACWALTAPVNAPGSR